MSCRNDGISTIGGTVSRPYMNAKLQPRTKLRCVNRLRFRKDRSVVRLWLTKRYRPATHRMASVTISLDWNQSRLPPRSSMSWKDPIATASVRKPNTSRRRVVSRSISGTNSAMPSVAAMPNGMLM